MRAGTVRQKQSKRLKDTGKLKQVRALAKLSEWADDRLKLELSCEGAFEAMYLSKMPRIYSESGQLHESFASAEFDVRSS